MGTICSHVLKSPFLCRRLFFSVVALLMAYPCVTPVVRLPVVTFFCFHHWTRLDIFRHQPSNSPAGVGVEQGEGGHLEDVNALCGIPAALEAVSAIDGAPDVPNELSAGTPAQIPVLEKEAGGRGSGNDSNDDSNNESRPNSEGGESPRVELPGGQLVLLEQVETREATAATAVDTQEESAADVCGSDELEVVMDAVAVANGPTATAAATAAAVPAVGGSGVGEGVAIQAEGSCTPEDTCFTVETSSVPEANDAETSEMLEMSTSRGESGATAAQAAEPDLPRSGGEEGLTSDLVVGEGQAVAHAPRKNSHESADGMGGLGNVGDTDGVVSPPTVEVVEAAADVKDAEDSAGDGSPGEDCDEAEGHFPQAPEHKAGHRDDGSQLGTVPVSLDPAAGECSKGETDESPLLLETGETSTVDQACIVVDGGSTIAAAAVVGSKDVGEKDGHGGVERTSPTGYSFVVAEASTALRDDDGADAADEGANVQDQHVIEVAHPVEIAVSLVGRDRGEDGTAVGEEERVQDQRTSEVDLSVGATSVVGGGNAAELGVDTALDEGVNVQDRHAIEVSDSVAVGSPLIGEDNGTAVVVDIATDEEDEKVQNKRASETEDSASFVDGGSGAALVTQGGNNGGRTREQDARTVSIAKSSSEDDGAPALEEGQELGGGQVTVEQAPGSASTSVMDRESSVVCDSGSVVVEKAVADDDAEDTGGREHDTGEEQEGSGERDGPGAVADSAAATVSSYPSINNKVEGNEVETGKGDHEHNVNENTAAEKTAGCHSPVASETQADAGGPLVGHQGTGNANAEDADDGMLSSASDSDSSSASDEFVCGKAKDDPSSSTAKRNALAEEEGQTPLDWEALTREVNAEWVMEGESEAESDFSGLPASPLVSPPASTPDAAGDSRETSGGRSSAGKEPLPPPLPDVVLETSLTSIQSPQKTDEEEEGGVDQRTHKDAASEPREVASSMLEATPSAKGAQSHQRGGSGGGSGSGFGVDSEFKEDSKEAANDSDCGSAVAPARGDEGSIPAIEGREPTQAGDRASTTDSSRAQRQPSPFASSSARLLQEEGKQRPPIDQTKDDGDDDARSAVSGVVTSPAMGETLSDSSSAGGKVNGDSSGNDVGVSPPAAVPMTVPAPVPAKTQNALPIRDEHSGGEDPPDHLGSEGGRKNAGNGSGGGCANSCGCVLM